MKERVVFLDWLRVIACFLVIMTHSNEPVYLGGMGTSVASAADAFWSTFFISLCRCCVPLFVLASSYLLFPLKYDTSTFFRKRLVRVGIPALVWLVLYSAFGGGSAAENFRVLPFNFPGVGGHLWFCYMIVGLYMLMPLLSPWAEKAGKKELQVVLGIWAFTTLIPALRELGLGVNESWSFWGEGNWNEFGTFYYVSGFIGYLLMGLYFRKYVGDLSWQNTLLVALPLFAGGFALTAAWFYGFMPKTFPFDQPIETAVHMEVMARFCTLSVAMMTVGAFLLIRKITCDGWFYQHIVLPVSRASYGMYLMHIFALVPLYAFWRGLFGASVSSAVASSAVALASGSAPAVSGASAGLLAGSFWATPCVVLCTALSTYLICALVSTLLQRLPKLGKFLVG